MSLVYAKLHSPSKPSRPSRAYLHLTAEQYLAHLSDKVRKTSFTDAKGSSNDSVLLGPPIVEFAPYGRLPTNKPRRDARQGTIDQDQEFIEFLESLTNPIPRVANIDVTAEKETKAGEAKMVTPLIQYLKDKKANKSKELVTPSKPSKHGRQESKDNKNPPPEKKAPPKGGKDNTGGTTEKRPATPAKTEKAARETPKATDKQQMVPTRPITPASASKTTPEPAAAQAAAQAMGSPAAKPERRRERGSASAAAKILQRDLGIVQSPQTRRKRDNTPSAGVASSALPQANSVTATEGISANAPPAQMALMTPSPSGAAPAPYQPPTAPAAARNQAKASSSQTIHAQAKPSPPIAPKSGPPASITPGATQAFLKHANPSQGVTESLLEEAFAPFGMVQRVEIDKKKGFAYVDFADSDGLQKAIAASPVMVGQGQVVVLERKTGASLHNRNARGGGAVPAVRGGVTPPAAKGSRGGSVRGRGGRSQQSVSKATANPAPAPASTAQSDGAAAQTPMKPRPTAAETRPASKPPC